MDDFKSDPEQAFRIAGKLDAGFPLKDGSGEKSFSVCCWFKYDRFGDRERRRSRLKRYCWLLVWWTKRSKLKRARMKLIEDVFVYRIGHGMETLDKDRWYHISCKYQAPHLDKPEFNVYSEEELNELPTLRTMLHEVRDDLLDSWKSLGPSAVRGPQPTQQTRRGPRGPG